MKFRTMWLGCALVGLIAGALGPLTAVEGEVAEVIAAAVTAAAAIQRWRFHSSCGSSHSSCASLGHSGGFSDSQVALASNTVTALESAESERRQVLMNIQQ